MAERLPPRIVLRSHARRDRHRKLARLGLAVKAPPSKLLRPLCEPIIFTWPPTFQRSCSCESLCRQS